MRTPNIGDIVRIGDAGQGLLPRVAGYGLRGVDLNASQDALVSESAAGSVRLSWS